ncbi:uncharacterized protein LOC144582151 [Callithrix jacchus]
MHREWGMRNELRPLHSLCLRWLHRRALPPSRSAGHTKELLQVTQERKLSSLASIRKAIFFPLLSCKFPKPHDSDFQDKGRSNLTQTHQGDIKIRRGSNVTTETEIGVMWLKTKEYLEAPDEKETEPPPRASRGSMALLTP